MHSDDVMEQIEYQIANLVRERQQRGVSLEVLSAEHGVSVEELQSVERLGMDASLASVYRYAEVLGYDTSLVSHVRDESPERPFRTCEICGEKPRHHKQHHSILLGACVDENISQLWIALLGLGVSVEGGCEGWGDARRGGEAHLTFPTLADARTFYALVDRTNELSWRAGLRGSTTRAGAWSSAVRWEMLPGDLLCDARVVVRFPHSDITELEQLAKRPPRAPFSELAMRSRDREDI
jgi:transcriptional regulator with XRE-family HTH domain